MVGIIIVKKKCSCIHGEISIICKQEKKSIFVDSFLGEKKVLWGVSPYNMESEWLSDHKVCQIKYFNWLGYISLWHQFTVIWPSTLPAENKSETYNFGLRWGAVMIWNLELTTGNFTHFSKLSELRNYRNI